MKKRNMMSYNAVNDDRSDHDESDSEESSSNAVDDSTMKHSKQQQEKEQTKTRTKKDDEQPPKKKNKVSSIVPLEVAPMQQQQSLIDPNHAANNSFHGSGSDTKKPIIILLDQASLETIKNKRGIYELLNCDDHRDICKKKLKKDPNIYRPDILHQELLTILDSPLNKIGLIKIYIQTKNHILIDVNPSIRIPRTYKRFSGLMVQLLHKMKIKASSNDGNSNSSINTTLLKVIKNPFAQYLPAGTTCYGIECQGQLYSPYHLAQSILSTSPGIASSKPPICFIVGAMSTGDITHNDHPYIQQMISISEYPLSGATALSRIIGGIEHHWGII